MRPLIALTAMQRCLTVLFAWGTLSACVAVAPGGEEATPQRPTFSSGTTTTAEGTLEVEFGIDSDPGERLDTPTVLKYGAGPRTETFLGLSPLVRISEGSSDASGFGDLLLGIRHRFWEPAGGTTTRALQVAAKLPTANDDNGLGNGEVELFAAVIESHQLREIADTVYYELGVVADPDGDGTGLRHALAIAASQPFDERLSGFLELAGIFDPNAPDPLFATGGASYALAPSTVLDAAVAVGLNGDAPDLRLLVGLTSNRGQQGLHLSSLR